MVRESKKTFTDIIADRDRRDNILKYQKLLKTAFNKYSSIRLALNLFTGLEVFSDEESEDGDKYKNIRESLCNVIVSILMLDTAAKSNEQLESSIELVTKMRDKITEDMRQLTYYTDSLEVYEYILNRREQAALGIQSENVDTDELANAMYNYVFSEQDKLIVNTRIQEMIAQLPVRMTKDRFLDIVANALSIYKGGEKDSLLDFAETVRDAALIRKDKKGTDLTDIDRLLERLSEADYKNLTKEELESITGEMDAAIHAIDHGVTSSMIIIEIINDLLVLLYSGRDILTEFRDKDDKYLTAKTILLSLAAADDIYKAAEEVDELLPNLEGAQEDAYEELLQIDSRLEELLSSYREEYADDKEISSNFEELLKCDRLTSSSYFMDIDKDLTVVEDVADEEFVDQVKSSVTSDLLQALSGKNKYLRRGIMAKVLSTLPVFFNSKDEILEYFQLALSGCSDESELAGCEKLINDIILSDF